MSLKIKTPNDFNNFCNANRVEFKLPQENSGKYYMLLSMTTSESATGLSDSSQVLSQNWELKSHYQDSDGSWMLVFEIWANSGIMPMPGSVGQEHLGKTIEIEMNNIFRVLSQFTNDVDPNDIWYIKKIQNTNVLENFMSN